MLLHDWLLRDDVAPGVDAIVHGAERWDRARLRAEVDRVRRLLAEAGVGWGDRCVVELEPAPGAVAALLALASLGAVYVPIDPELPAARRDALLATIAPAAIMGPAGLARAAGGGGVQRAPAAADPAYIIMTSGSTGAPKGIVMSHGAAVAALRGFCDMGIAPDARIGSISPLHFDFSLLDLGLALGSGATLVQVPRILVHQPRGLVDYLAAHRVTQMNGVPSIWRPIIAGDHRALLARLTALDTIVYGAESFAARDLATLQAWRPDVRIVQAFGHSESIGCCFKTLENPAPTLRGRVAFGRALRGTEVFALDDAGAEVAAQQVGELHVAGPHLFSGYLGDPALGAARLVPDPRPGRTGTVFRSGDLVFRDDAGDWYFAGRIDHQVKVRGNRVELSEIERTLEDDPDVAAAVVVASGDGATLTAFVVPAGPRGDLTAALRARLAGALPRYMIPRELRLVDALPRLASGKVDRRALAGSLDGRTA